MANNSSEESLVDIEEPEEKKAESVDGLGKSSIAKITSFRKDGKNRPLNTIWPRIKKITDPQGRFLQMWNMIFIISCVFAVSLDPLFFYIPIIDRDIKCLKLDNRLKTIAFALRSLTDLFYMVDLVLQILLISNAKPSAEIVASQGTKTSADQVLSETKNTNLLAVVERAFGLAKRILQSYIIVVDILAVLPIPQVVIFIFFSQMKGSRCLKTRKLLNALVLLQYIPRILRIYLLCNECKKTPKKPGIWAKSVFNFFLYILASHVLGALWYFFSIQRETACWKYACGSGDGCELSSFDCNDIHTLRNVTLLNNLCPVYPSNATLFDFGIFLDALQSGMVVSTDFPEKFLYCFWWGLRNLSSLGQNFQTSTYAWENLFAVFISIIGLMLFIYLIGNLQTYLQFATTRSEKLRRKMKWKNLEVDLWLSRNGLPNNFKEVIMNTIHQKLEQNKDVDVENILDVLPSEHSENIKSCLHLAKLNLEVDLWLSRNGLPNNFKEVIMQTIHQKVKQNEDVDVENILDVLPPAHSQYRKYIKLYFRLATIKKVPMFQTMKVKLLKAISERLKLVDYAEDTCIIVEGDKLDKMLFFTHGTVKTYKKNRKGGKIGCEFLKKGDFYGSDELLTWASKFGSPSKIPESTRMVKSVSKVEAFVLSADDLFDVAVMYWWHFTKNKDLKGFSKSMLEKFAKSSIEKHIRQSRQGKKKHSIKQYLRLATLKKVPMLQNMEVKVLKEIGEHLEMVDFAQDTCVIKEGNKLDKMLFITHGTVQTYKTNGKGGKIGPEFLEKGDFYGSDELLTWASKFGSSNELPISVKMVKTVTKVEAIVLSADDLKSVFIKYWWHFTKNKDLKDFSESMLEEFAESSIEKQIRWRRQEKKKRDS